MIVALQTSGLGIDMTIATSLIEIGIVGAPLILAVCQFINNRNDPRTDAQTVIESALLGSLSLISVSLMWGLFLVGSIWIWQETEYSPTSNILLSLAFVYFIFILLISLYQFYYMVDERLRGTVFSYILGIIMIIMVIIASFQSVAIQEDRYFYLIIISVLFITGTILYPPVNSILSNYIPFLREIPEGDSKNRRETNDKSKRGIILQVQEEYINEIQSRVDNDISDAEAIRYVLDQAIQCESQAEQLESDLNHAEAQIEELERENECLKNEKQLILERRNENTELVEYVEEERSYRKAGVTTRMKWWIFGME